jgi:hypothetical protein
MVKRMKLDGEMRSVSVRESVTRPGKVEYCCGLDMWRGSAKAAWRDYRLMTAAKSGDFAEMTAAVAAAAKVNVEEVEYHLTRWAMKTEADYVAKCSLMFPPSFALKGCGDSVFRVNGADSYVERGIAFMAVERWDAGIERWEDFAPATLAELNSMRVKSEEELERERIAAGMETLGYWEEDDDAKAAWERHHALQAQAAKLEAVQYPASVFVDGVKAMVVGMDAAGKVNQDVWTFLGECATADELFACVNEYRSEVGKLEVEVATTETIGAGWVR